MPNGRIPSLDGIRALSIGLVLLAHAGLGHVIPGGFGVTVFFFLSGYLITYLLRQEHQARGSVNLKSFYLRRIFRLLPALYFVLTLNAALGLLGVLPHNMSTGVVAAQYLHLTNYVHIYHGTNGMVPATGVLWSLAVEEHFYLLYPLLLIVALRMTHTKPVVVLSSICLLVLVWRLSLVGLAMVPDSYTYMATDARIDSILFGCILGLIHSSPTTRVFEKLSDVHLKSLFLFAVLVLCCTFLYREAFFRETWRYSVQGLALMPMFHCAIKFSQWPLFFVLNTPIFRWLGDISYSLYLVHSVCFFFVKEWLGSSLVLNLVIGVPLSLLVAHVVYLQVEKRFLDMRKRLRFG